MSGGERLSQIVVSPTLRFDDWRRRLIDAAVDAGFVQTPNGELVRGDATARQKFEIVHSLTRQHWAKDGIALLVDLQQALDAVASVKALPPPRDAQEASRLLTRLHGLPDRITVGEATTSLDVLGLTVEPLENPAIVQSGRGLDLAEAFGLYAETGEGRIAPSLLTYDRAYAGEPGWIDLTGRPRLLAYGPTLWLPPGRWTLTLRIQIEAGADGRWFQVDWGTQTACDHIEFRPERVGDYEVSMSFTWSEPAPAEFRLKVFEGCFEGSLRIVDLKIARIDAQE